MLHSRSIHCTTLPSIKLLLSMVFPLSLLHFSEDESLLFRTTRGQKSSKRLRACWLTELLLPESITAISHIKDTVTPSISTSSSITQNPKFLKN